MSIGELALQSVYENAPDSLSYAIIRPGGLVDGSPAGPAEIILNQGMFVLMTISFSKSQ